MRARHFPQWLGLIGILGIALGLAGCVYVPPSPYGPGYYAPAGAVVVAPRPYYDRPYPYPYGYRYWR